MEILLDRYDMDVYTLPYWLGETVFHEAVMPISNPGGTLEDIALMYKAEQIRSVRSSDLETAYAEGKDYALADGKLRILPGSAIAIVPYGAYYPPQQTADSKRLSEACGPGYIFFSEDAWMHTRQLSVTYTHKDPWSGPIPACKRTLLPKTQEKLKTGKPLNICVFGDSICVGGNSSGFLGAKPHAPIWPQMLVDKLVKAYPQSEISFSNPSVGGKTSGWGAEEAQARVGYGPDLCVIGFGMNDGTKRVPPEEYQQNIKAIMEIAAAGNPNCEFVLVATTLPNPQVGRFFGDQQAYLPMLTMLEKVGVAVADMTTFHQELLRRKQFYHMSANNVNHPNDFMARAYAQVLWQTIIGY